MEPSTYQNEVKTVGLYQVVTASNRPIRKATVVTFADGYQVHFLERAPRRIALPLARKIEEKCNRMRMFAEGRLAI